MWDIIENVAAVVISTTQSIFGLTDEAKIDLIVTILDNLIKLPMLLEPFDGPIIHYAVQYVFKMLKKNGIGVHREIDIQRILNGGGYVK